MTNEVSESVLAEDGTVKTPLKKAYVKPAIEDFFGEVTVFGSGEPGDFD